MENRTQNGMPKQMSKPEKAEMLYQKAKKLMGKQIDIAQKCLEKAENIHSTPKAKELLRQIRKSRFENKSNGPASSKSRCDQSNRPGSSGIGRQIVNKENVGRSRPRLSSASYTSEQIEAVRRVMRCKNYYEIFEVTSDASEEQIKVAYKKLALVLHPDKNSAPGAEQAMQEVNKASKTLLDPDSRRTYDAETFRPRFTHGNFGDILSEMDFTNVEVDTGSLLFLGLAAGVGMLGMWWLEREARNNRNRQ